MLETRLFLGIAAFLIAGASLFAQSLRNLADERGIHVGAAVDPSRFNETAYATTLAREFNQVEPENVMKFGLVHPARTSYNFGPPDAIVGFGNDHNMVVRGHTLVWHNQNPAWLTRGSFTPAELASILQDHINSVVGHYAGKVYAWDVVNEAFNDNGRVRSTLWSDSPGIGLAGTAYIEQALKWAHAADPKALLFYNDYSAEALNAKSDAIYKMAQDFKSRGVPIDGVGLQMHLTTSPPSLAGIDSNIKRITDLGLQVQITELDVRLPVDSTGHATAAMLSAQAQIYGDVVALCLKYPKCTAVQTWGFTDKFSWVPGAFPGMGAALPIDANYQPKAAYNAIASSLKTSPPVLNRAGLGSAASYASEVVAPGEIVVLYGATFGPASLVFAQPDATGRLPTQLSGTRLLFDGNPAPILYASVGQVGAVVPFSVASQTSTQLEYEYQTIRSNPVTVEIAPTQPGIFTLDSSGQGDGAILDVDYRLVSAVNPARRGSYILLFATGGGITSPPSVDGLITASTPLPVLSAGVSAKIGGVACPVQYSGAASGLIAGAVQVNVQVDSDVPAGQQPLILTIGDTASQPGVTVWVQ